MEALAAFIIAMTLTPGPNNLMIMSSGVNFGVRRSLPHYLGICLGFALLSALVGAGLGSALQSIPLAWQALQWAGGAYLLWMAWILLRTALRQSETADIEAAQARPLNFAQAVLFQWDNPKAWTMAVVGMATFSGIGGDYLNSLLIVTAGWLIVGSPCVAVWLCFGAMIREWLKRPLWRRHFNLTMALLLLVSAVSILRLPEAQASVPDARISAELPGVYRGTLPCADCPGIAVRLVLQADGQYQRSQTWLDQGAGAVRHDRGTFQWDARANRITLQADDATNDPQSYALAEQRLLHLDRSGQRIEGDLAEHYVLRRNPRDKRLEGIEWQLSWWSDQPETTGEGTPTLALDSQRGMLAGTDGCNRYTGSYDLTGDGGLQLGLLASTRRACPDMAQADGFQRMLGRVRSYRINEDVLILLQEDGKVLARMVVSMLPQ